MELIFFGKKYLEPQMNTGHHLSTLPVQKDTLFKKLNDAIGDTVLGLNILNHTP